jgi:hypothetical protein
MSSNEISWLDILKEHKWTIIVAAICVFAGITYFAMGNQPVSDASSGSSTAPAYTAPSATPTSTVTAKPTSTASPSPTPTVPTVTVGTAQQAPTPTDWNPVANAFAKAWANPKIGKEAWLSAIKPTVTSDLYDQFANTDITRVGQLEVAKISSEQTDYAGVNARVYFKNTDFTIMIHLEPQADMTWLVSVVTRS